LRAESRFLLAQQADGLADGLPAHAILARHVDLGRQQRADWIESGLDGVLKRLGQRQVAGVVPGCFCPLPSAASISRNSREMGSSPSTLFGLRAFDACPSMTALVNKSPVFFRPAAGRPRGSWTACHLPDHRPPASFRQQRPEARRPAAATDTDCTVLCSAGKSLRNPASVKPAVGPGPRDIPRNRAMPHIGTPLADLSTASPDL